MTLDDNGLIIITARLPLMLQQRSTLHLTAFTSTQQMQLSQRPPGKDAVNPLNPQAKCVGLSRAPLYFLRDLRVYYSVSSAIKKNFLTFLFMSFLLTSIAYCQEREITVRVIDEATKKAIKSANIVVSGSTKASTTNILGYFRIKLSPSEKYLEISHVTYTTATILVPEEASTFTVPLKRNVYLLSDIDLRIYPNDFVLTDVKEKPLNAHEPRPDSLIVVEFMAGFPYEGGVETFRQLFGNKFQFPETELLQKKNGKILLTFKIDSNGDYQDVSCLNDLENGLCDEFKRILKDLPKWTPGEQRGERVEQSFAMFVHYGVNNYWDKKIKQIKKAH
jgi:hypothetical protein